jgi:galactokinase
MMSLEEQSVPAAVEAERYATLEGMFRERYRRVPTTWVRAPGRVDLMGSHTDYNEGRVLTLAVDRDTWVAGSPRADGRVRVFSLNLNAAHEFDVARACDVRGGWAAYVAGVVNALVGYGAPSSGFDAVIHGTVPLASGLSSSASLTVVIGRLLARLGGLVIEPVQLARLCQQAEHEAVGVPCGLLDPCSAILGRAGHSILLDCARVQWSHTSIDEGLSIVVADTRVPRSLATSGYGQRREECEAGVAALRASFPGLNALCELSSESFARHRSRLPPVLARRCGFVIEEDQRVEEMAGALASGDRGRIGALCEASFRGARDGYEICVPAMESMWEALRASSGCVGARQAGAGFGGCLVAVVERAAVRDFVEEAGARFESSWGAAGRLFEVRSTDGAGDLSPTSADGAFSGSGRLGP